jgi:hypothetical protein
MNLNFYPEQARIRSPHLGRKQYYSWMQAVQKIAIDWRKRNGNGSTGHWSIKVCNIITKQFKAYCVWSSQVNYKRMMASMTLN